MNIIVKASTKYDHQATKQEMEYMAGKAAGTCYMSSMDFEKLNNEPIENSIKRANMTKTSGHHSVFGHGFISFELENVPKLFAMLLNNEKMYTTSEKSARYTKMIVSEQEEILYNKWKDKLIELIKNKYGNEPYFSEKRISKIAMENARYFTSVLTPTSLVYTTNYQQLNYMCGWLSKFSEKDNQIYKMLKPIADEFLNKMEDLGYLDDVLMQDGKNREFSLVAKRAREEQFGECYSVNYKCTFACLAQIHRTRPLSYELSLLEDKEYYIPELLKQFPDLVKEWIDDMQTVANLTPQGELIAVNERGNYENLILKAKERLCTATQLEAMQITRDTINKIITNTNNEYVKKDLEKINNGARCVNGYKCTTPCAFKDGINLSRNI